MNAFVENVVRELESPNRKAHLNILVPESKVTTAFRALAISGFQHENLVWTGTDGRTVKVLSFLSSPEAGPFVICNGGEEYPSAEHKALLKWYDK
jgi:hypothetical protein